MIRKVRHVTAIALVTASWMTIAAPVAVASEETPPASTSPVTETPVTTEAPPVEVPPPAPPEAPQAETSVTAPESPVVAPQQNATVEQIVPNENVQNETPPAAVVETFAPVVATATTDTPVGPPTEAPKCRPVAPQQVQGIIEPDPYAQAAQDLSLPPCDSVTGEAITNVMPDVPKLKEFYRGDFGSGGTPDMFVANKSLFVGLGYYNIGGLHGEHYARITPALNLYFELTEQKKPLMIRLEVPFNVLMKDLKDDGHDKKFGSLRSEDYNEPGDYLRYFRRIQFGRKEERLFFSMSMLYGINVGHGQTVRRYNPNMDPDRTRLGVQLDAYNDWMGFESFVADLSFQSQVMGGLVFVKPLQFFVDNPYLKSISIGSHYTTDLNAPVHLVRNSNGNINVDKYNYPKFTSTAVGIVGFDTEMKLYQKADLMDLKAYVDYSMFTGDGGGGFTTGALWRGSVGDKPGIHAWRARLEYRAYQSNYKPQYFDGMYEIQKFQFLFGKHRGNEGTKYEEIALSKNKSTQHNMYTELNYTWLHKVVTGVGIERNFSNGTNNLLIQLEWPAFKVLRLYAVYQKLGYLGISKSFERSADKRGMAPDSILYTQVRFQLMKALYLNTMVRQQYQLDTKGRYQPKFDYLMELQVGGEFAEDSQSTAAQAAPAPTPQN